MPDVVQASPESRTLVDSWSYLLRRSLATVESAIANSATIGTDLQSAEDVPFQDSTPLGSGKMLAAATGAGLPVRMQQFHGRTRHVALLREGKTTLVFVAEAQMTAFLRAWRARDSLSHRRRPFHERKTSSRTAPTRESPL